MLRILHLRVLNLPEDGSSFVPAGSQILIFKTKKALKFNDLGAFCL